MVIGLLSAVIPLAVILQFLSMSRIDPDLRDAAQNLGASPFQVFLRVDLRYALPGVVLSFVFAFLIAAGDFLAPSVLGGNNAPFLSTAILDRVRINEWPSAAVLGHVLMAMTSLILFGGSCILTPTILRKEPGG